MGCEYVWCVGPLEILSSVTMVFTFLIKQFASTYNTLKNYKGQASELFKTDAQFMPMCQKHGYMSANEFGFISTWEIQCSLQVHARMSTIRPIYAQVQSKIQLGTTVAFLRI